MERKCVQNVILIGASICDWEREREREREGGERREGEEGGRVREREMGERGGGGR